jgi:hypothetical protein
MHTIYKYPLTLGAQQFTKLPIGYTIMHVGLDPTGEVCMWAKVPLDDSEGYAECEVRIHGTGHTLSDNLPPYIGSFVDRCYVWHVFAK